jgi:bromodomain adjacent to zinc finger domain protein 1A
LFAQTVPQGEWFCPTCRPKEVKPPTPRKSRRIFTEEESEEEEENSDDEEQDEEEQDR